MRRHKASPTSSVGSSSSGSNSAPDGLPVGPRVRKEFMENINTICGSRRYRDEKREMKGGIQSERVSRNDKEREGKSCARKDEKLRRHASWYNDK